MQVPDSEYRGGELVPLEAEAGYGDTGPSLEQRRETRYELSMPAEVRTIRGVVDFVYIRDVSTSGLCFRTAQWFLVGEEIDITLHFSDRLNNEALRGTVVWFTDNRGERYYGVYRQS